MNTFGYVGQSPLSAIDIKGLETCIPIFVVPFGNTYSICWGNEPLPPPPLSPQSASTSGSTTTDSASNSIWGDGATDHPSHDDERDALSTPLSATCEELAWAISVLQAGIDWRKGDIARHGGNNPRAPGHRQWIKKLQDELDQLLREHNLHCEEKCEDK